MVEVVTEDFYESTGHKLSSTSFLKLFNILKDDDDNLFLNIFRTFSINETTMSSVLNYQTYEVDEGDFIENISYDLYENLNLWWLILLSNSIVNPFEDIYIGQNLKILKETLIPFVMREMRNISEE